LTFFVILGPDDGIADAILGTLGNGKPLATCDLNVRIHSRF